jgi:hypothetical protein
VLGVIQRDPVADGVDKIILPYTPLVFTAYVASPIWVVYGLEGTVIVVRNVGRAATGAPRPW